MLPVQCAQCELCRQAFDFHRALGFSPFPEIQTDSVSHLTGSVLVRGCSVRGVRLATNFQIVPRLGADGVITLLPLTPSLCAKDNITPAFQ